LHSLTRRLSAQKSDNLESLKTAISTYFETNTFAEGRLTTFSKERHPGTARWILEEPEYLSWLDQSSPLLWVSGPPGAGKTHISSFLIEELRRKAEAAPRCSVAHFFIRYAEKDTRSLKNALASSIVRISETDEEYCICVAAEVTKLKKGAGNFGNVDLGTIWKLFFLDQYTADSNAHLFLVIDGLDEADAGERDAFLDLVDQLGNDDPVGIQILLVGQQWLDDTVTRLTSTWVHRILVSSAKNSQDITKFLNEKINMDRNIRRFAWWKGIREEVIAALLKNAEGGYTISK
jgi:hypothetical protein